MSRDALSRLVLIHNQLIRNLTECINSLQSWQQVRNEARQWPQKHRRLNTSGFVIVPIAVVLHPTL